MCSKSRASFTNALSTSQGAVGSGVTFTLAITIGKSSSSSTRKQNQEDAITTTIHVLSYHHHCHYLLPVSRPSL
jgi:hypothetical protein